MSGKNFSCRALATFQVLALLITLSPLTFSQTKGRKTKSPETVYSNPASITINTATGLTAPTKAAVYPSDIAVSGMTGTVTRVAVTLTGVNHATLNHLDLLLVSPSGAKFIFMSDVPPNGFSSIDKVFTFSDDAPATFPNAPIVTGNYKPTSGDGIADTFPAPAPAGPYLQPPGSTFATAYNGSNANGTWSLYVADDTLATAGNITEGWALTVTTDASPATFANSAAIGINDITTPATPYGSTINVSGATGAISNLKVTLTGYSHAAVTDVDVLLVSPNGKGLILMSDAGTGVASNANLTFDDAAPGTIPGSIVTGTYKPSDTTGFEVDVFQPPAPPAPYHLGSANQLSNFYGFSPNGDWKLYVIDDAQNSGGSISGGWSLDITTTAIVPPPPPSCSSPSFSVTNVPVGTGPTNVAVADYNNDGKADLAVTNQVSNDVSVLLGNGSGGFSAQPTLTAGSGPYAIVAGKFNADTNFDLAVANSTSNNVSIFLGNGNGTFSAPANFFVGPSPISIALGDFNNDTKQDLVTANFGGFFSGSVSLLLGTGSGGFTTGNSVRTRTQPSFVTVANFNGDANQDLAVANFGSNSVSTYFGTGTGGFNLSQNLVSQINSPVAIEVADFTGSGGFPDLAIANYNSDVIIACAGSASGTFTCQGFITDAIANPISITSGDFTGGGSILLGIALSGTNFVRVGNNNVPVGLSPNAVEAANFNADSKLDIVAVNAGSNDVSIMLNICQVAVGNIFDYTGDKRTSLTQFRSSTTAWWLYPTANPFIFGHPGDTPVPADYDGDRITDYSVYRPESGLWVIIDRFNRPVYNLQFGLPGDIAMPADYDGDAKADIAVFRPSDGNWYIRRSTDNVTQVSAFGMNGDLPVAADYDGDKIDDIAVFRPLTGVWYVFRSSDSQIMITQWGMNGDKTVAGDYDGDGKADLTIWRPSDGAWYALRSSDGGVNAMYWGQFGDLPVVGDYDGDGKYDFAIWRPTDNLWYVFRSSDGIPSYTLWGLSTDRPIPNAFVR